MGGEIKRQARLLAVGGRTRSMWMTPEGAGLTAFGERMHRMDGHLPCQWRGPFAPSQPLQHFYPTWHSLGRFRSLGLDSSSIMGLGGF